jgi:molecular chaperone DnaK
VSELAIGIDLGTSTSEIAVFRGGEPYVVPDPGTKIPIVPSLVALDRNSRIKVGEEARSWVDSPGHGVKEVKRLMGSAERVTLLGNAYRPEEISSNILKKLKANAEEAFHKTISEVVISVPANFPDAARTATYTAGELAGLKVLRLINEPTAAALAFGIKNLDVEEQLVVFDFGGGTLDVTVLEMVGGVMDVKCSFGDPKLGGKDFDQLLVESFLGRFTREHPAANVSQKAYNMLTTFTEKAKKGLSTSERFTDILPFFGVENGRPVDLEADLTREEFERLSAPLLTKARTCLVEALARKDVTPESVDRVLLVGGATFMPCVRRLVAEFFRREPTAEVQPDLAVAMGASIQAALAKGLIDENKGLILTDVSPFGLGIDVFSRVGAHYVLLYDELMPPNTSIPFSVKRDYSLLHETQDAFEIHVLQDNTGKAKLPVEAQETGIKGRIEDIPESEDGTPRGITLHFSYDLNGMAKLRAEVEGTGKMVEISFVGSDLRMEGKEKAEAAKRVHELWRSNDLGKDYEAYITKAENLAPELSAADRDQLLEALGRLKQALTRGNSEAAKKAGDRLIDVMFDIQS